MAVGKDGPTRTPPAAFASPPPPFASPSLSPSIVSLLNPASSAHDVSPDDYFSHDVTAPRLDASASPALVFGPASGTSSPASAGAAARPGSAAGAAAFSHLLAPDPAFAPSPSPPLHPSDERPRSAKRPRTADDAAPPPLPPAPAVSASPAPPPPGPPPPPSGRPLEASIFMVEPIDEFTREVADWLWGFCSELDWDVLEIEAKVGVLIDTRSRGRSRFQLPVPIETILTDDTGLRFESNMTVNEHKHFNQLLNLRVEESAVPSYPHAPIRYAHTRETDTFHDDFVPGAGGGRRKVRVTTDQKNPNKVTRVVEKTRIADMNIYSPKRRFDWRISVNLEQPAPTPSGPITNTRFKDRISYSHQLFQVDLTQVTTDRPAHGPGGPPVGGETKHELEVEFRDAKVLMHEAQKEVRGEANQYLEMVQCFLNNIRMLIRNAADS